MKKILLVNGPNLNLLGTREPEIYGYATLKDIENDLTGYFAEQNAELSCFQSNHEGEIIDFLHQNRDADFIIINPAAFTHTSVALRDALTGIAIPFIEIHISNVHARESFRHHSYLSDLASGIIVGCGVTGYKLAAISVMDKLR